MTQNATFDLSLSPEAFFRERITTASHKLNIPLADEVEFYLVNLLIEFIDPTQLNKEFGTDILATPLVLLLKQIGEAPESKRPAMYRRLGDTSLYISGYFQDYFNDKAFDINYFMMMGASAYYQAAALTRNPGRKANQRQTLERISDNFGQLVDIVAEAADVSLRLKPTEILGVYDRWNRTGSERLRHILLELGITPVSVPYKVAQ